MSETEQQGEVEQAEAASGRAKKDKPDSSTPAEAPSFKSMATRQLQRGRKALGEPDGGPLADYLIRSATVMAILELADAVRGNNGSL